MKISLVLCTLMAMQAIALDCDTEGPSKACQMDYATCQANIERNNYTQLCHYCLIPYGHCLNATDCRGDLWDAYGRICNGKPQCKGCLYNPPPVEESSESDIPCDDRKKSLWCYQAYSNCWANLPDGNNYTQMCTCILPYGLCLNATGCKAQLWESYQTTCRGVPQCQGCLPEECDAFAATRKCTSEFDTCKQGIAETDNARMCACIVVYGTCLEKTGCREETWDAYGALCKEKKCQGCDPGESTGAHMTLTMTVSLVALTVLFA